MRRSGIFRVWRIRNVDPLDHGTSWEVYVVSSTSYFWRGRCFECDGVAVDIETLVD